MPGANAGRSEIDWEAEMDDEKATAKTSLPKLRRGAAVLAMVGALGGGVLLSGCGGDSGTTDTGNAQREAEKGVEKAEQGIEEGREKAKKGIEEGKEAAEKGIEEAKKEFENSHSSSKKKAEEAKEKIEEGVEEAKKKAEELIP